MWVLCPTSTFKEGTRRFGREQTGKNAPNIWFSGPGKMRTIFFFFYVTMAATEVGSVSSIDVQEQGQDMITLLFLYS
jgi:hypothetical protein